MSLVEKIRHISPEIKLKPSLGMIMGINKVTSLEQPYLIIYENRKTKKGSIHERKKLNLDIGVIEEKNFNVGDIISFCTIGWLRKINKLTVEELEDRRLEIENFYSAYNEFSTLIEQELLNHTDLTS